MTLYQSMWRPWLAACIFVLLSAPVPTGASQVMGRVYVVKSDPSNPASVFAAAQQGVFKSADAGATWTATSLTQPAIALAIAPVTPTTVYAGTDSGLFKSTDGGTTWSTAGVSNPVSSVEIDPAIPTTLYASIGSQIIKSADSGANWSSVGPTGYVAIAAAPPLILYVGTAITGGIEVFSSTDGGATWINASVSNPDPGYVPIWGLSFDLSIDPTIATTAYVNSSGWGCDGDGCFTIGTISQSTDGGATWFAVDQLRGYYGSWVWPQIGVSPVAVDPLQSSIFYAAWNVFCDQHDPYCAGFGIVSDAWISKYGGATGPRISNLSAWALWFDLLNPTVLYAATASGVLQSTDGGVTWSGPGAPPADTAPPETAVTSAADGAGTAVPNGAVTLSTSLTLTFNGIDNVGLSRFECQLDAGGFSACSSPLTYSRLALGGHTFEVRAVDTSNNVDPTPARHSWTIAAPAPPADTTPPDTSISSARDGNGIALANDAVTLSTALTLSFTGTDNVGLSRFECQLDGAGFSTCTSPLAYNALTLGAHSFEVRAVDTSGNVDATPARYRWTVDAAPETTINGAVDGRGKSLTNGGRTTSDKVTFRFAGTDNGTVTGFECRLDAGSFTSCTSPLTYTGINRGTHKIQVRAIDNNGFRDQSPAVFTWTK